MVDFVTFLLTALYAKVYARGRIYSLEMVRGGGGMAGPLPGIAMTSDESGDYVRVCFSDSEVKAIILSHQDNSETLGMKAPPVGKFDSNVSPKGGTCLEFDAFMVEEHTAILMFSDGPMDSLPPCSDVEVLGRGERI